MRMRVRLCLLLGSIAGVGASGTVAMASSSLNSHAGVPVPYPKQVVFNYINAVHKGNVPEMDRYAMDLRFSSKTQQTAWEKSHIRGFEESRLRLVAWKQVDFGLCEALLSYVEDGKPQTMTVPEVLIHGRWILIVGEQTSPLRHK
ncbi:MAG: hypothetical protein K6T30_03890 [Alicyclobacillus sp.]|nr:hypothetical protein [Alicyclobacillus sp.]